MITLYIFLGWLFLGIMQSFVIFVYIKSIGEEFKIEYIRGVYSKEDVKRWKKKTNKSISKILYKTLIILRILTLFYFVAVIIYLISRG